MDEPPLTLQDLDRIDKEVADIDARMTQREQDGISETVKYFDRINDKSSSVNTLLIGGYLSLIAFKDHVPPIIIVVPVLNLIFLWSVDYYMMKRSRLLSRCKSLNSQETNEIGNSTDYANTLSIFLIVSTLLVLGVFVYFLVKWV